MPLLALLTHLKLCTGPLTLSPTCPSPTCTTIKTSILAFQQNWMTNRNYNMKTFNDISTKTGIPFKTIKKRIKSHEAEYFNLRSIPETGADEVGVPCENPWMLDRDLQDVGERVKCYPFYPHELASFYNFIQEENLLRNDITTYKELLEFLKGEFRAIYRERCWGELCPGRRCLGERKRGWMVEVLVRDYVPELDQSGRLKRVLGCDGGLSRGDGDGLLEDDEDEDEDEEFA